MLRLMREAGLFVPQRDAAIAAPWTPRRTIVPEAPNVLWGTDDWPTRPQTGGSGCSRPSTTLRRPGRVAPAAASSSGSMRLS